jgi:hypothetical protein
MCSTKIYFLSALTILSHSFLNNSKWPFSKTFHHKNPIWISSRSYYARYTAKCNFHDLSILTKLYEGEESQISPDMSKIFCIPHSVHFLVLNTFISTSPLYTCHAFSNQNEKTFRIRIQNNCIFCFCVSHINCGCDYFNYLTFKFRKFSA